MIKARTRWISLVLSALSLTVGCTTGAAVAPISTGSASSVLSLPMLMAAPADQCAITGLGDAVRSAGLSMAGTPTGSVATNTGLAQDMGGVSVDCRVALNGNRVLDLHLLAGRNGVVAVNGLARRLQADLQIASDDLGPVVDAATKLKPGEFADLPGTKAVILTPLDVDGATTAALEMSGSGSVTRNDLRVVATALQR